MSQIQTKFIANSAVTTAKIAADAISGAKIRLDNLQALRARNAANSADVDALRVNASDLLELLTNVELSDRKLLNALVNFSTQSADPASPAQGDVYYNTVSNKLRQYNGTAWEDVSSGVAGANTSLSNLSAVAINTDLVFDSGANPTIQTKNEVGIASFGLNITTGDTDTVTSGSLIVTTGNNSAGGSGPNTISTGSAVGSTSGAIFVNSGNSDTATGNVEFKSGNATGAAAPSGTALVATGDTDAAVSGAVTVKSGNVVNAVAEASGTVEITTGSSDFLTGAVNISSANSGSGNSGDIVISTGTAAVTRGEVTIGGRNVTVTGSNDIALNADQTATLGTLSSTGGVTVVTSQTISVNDNSAAVSVRSGDVTGTGESGNVNISTGSGEDGNETGRVNITTGDLNVTGVETGQITLRTGSANGTSGESGPVIIRSGDSVADSTGGVNIFTGTAVDDDSRGPVSIAGRRIQFDAGPLLITNFASDPTNLSTYFAGDFYYNTTSNKLRFYDGAVWADVGAATTLPTNEKTLITLSAGDITNQYVDLAHVARTNSIDFLVRGGGIMVEGASYDYSVSYTGGAGGNTRITFLNDLATGGASALVASDVVVVKYERI